MGRWNGYTDSTEQLVNADTVLVKNVSDTDQNVAGSVNEVAFSDLSTSLGVGINVKAYGALGDGSTDDSTAIQAALAAADTAGGGCVKTPPNTDYNIGTTTISVPSGCSLQMGDGSTFLYSGAGVAVQVEPSLQASYNTVNEFHQANCIRVQRDAVEWDDATDTTSIGIKFINQRYSTHRITAKNFETGVLLYADKDDGPSGGFTDNIFFIEGIRNNKRGLRFTSVNPASSVNGWVNQNTFIGGYIRIDSAYDDGGTFIAGTRYIDLEDLGNGNTFLGINLEGAYVEKTVIIGSVANVFLNCRYEDAVEIEFKSTALQNQFTGGYGIGPGSGITITDASETPATDVGHSRNMITGGYNTELLSRYLGGNVLDMRGQTSLDTITAFCVSSANYILTVNAGASRLVATEITQKGNYQVYHPTTYKYHAVDNPGGSVHPFTKLEYRGLYLGVGTATPIRAIGYYNATTWRFYGTGDMGKGVFKLSCPTYANNAAALTDGADVGNVYKTAAGALNVVVPA